MKAKIKSEIVILTIENNDKDVFEYKNNILYHKRNGLIINEEEINKRIKVSTLIEKIKDKTNKII
jgi:hypothetical protein